MRTHQESRVHRVRSRQHLMIGVVVLVAGCADARKSVETDRKAGLALLQKYEAEGRDATFGDPKVRKFLPQRIRNVRLREATFRAALASTKLAGEVEAMDNDGHWEAGPFTLFVQSGSVIAARFPGFERALTAPPR
jgi:hypothetical protein